MNTIINATIYLGVLHAVASNTDDLEDITSERTQSFYGTNDRSIQKCEIVDSLIPSRSERSWQPHLDIALNVFGTLLNTTLYVVEDNDLINRRQTGIWDAHPSTTAYQNVRYTPWPEAFDMIGNFELLQNVEEGSAITRFWDSYGNETIIGILRHSYTIKSVPKNFDYAFGERPANLTNDLEKNRLFVQICRTGGVSREYVRRRAYAKNDTLPDSNLHRRRRQSTNATTVPDVVRPKILVIPDFGTVDRYRYCRDFIMQLIGHLNSVDMMFRQLKDPEVHLNIAGIIIPWDDKATPYMSKHVNAHNRLDGEAAVREAEMNFQMEKRRFPHDEWDAILMLTTYNINSYNGGLESQVGINGYSPIARGCSGAAAIARFTENMEGIYTLAHGLGHMFGVKHDEDEFGAKQCTNTTGYLMVTDFNYLEKLEWSNCSRAAFQTYFRSDAGNCTYSGLREIPGAIKNMHGPWLSIDGQCDNHFKKSTDYCMKKLYGLPDCSTYGCKINNTCNWMPSPPLKGSLFSDISGRWACVDDIPVFLSAFI